MYLTVTATLNLKSESNNLLGWQPTDFLDKKGMF